MSDLHERLTSAITDRYTVERELGRGGMAAVFLAQDLKHRRKVAVKVLFPELAQAIGTARFLREIEIVAGLDHPHILPLYDSGAVEGLVFFVMPYAEGESLRGRIERERQLPVEQALDIAQEIADGLHYAHEHGVVHRDLKPENVLLSQGHARIADFGVARAISEAGDRITATGLAVGTPSYMSPEQASGQPEIDARADVYALGCVLYEMLAGEVPLGGATLQAMAARRLSETPTALHTVRPSVPPQVDQIVRRTLAPVPADRYATAQEVAAALGEALRGEPSTVTTVPPAPPPTSIAVLPFANLSPDPENDYFSDGITEELINALAGVEGLQVAARTSVFAFKGKAEDVRGIGRQLSVGAILEGSVRKHGNRVRIAAQFVNVADGYQLWSNKFDREFADIFAIQEEISLAIVENLRAHLLPSAKEMLGSHGTSNVHAYNSYLRGRFHLHKRTWEAFERAVEDFGEALEADPEYAEAHAGLADAYLLLERYGVMPPSAAFAKARASASRALEIDPDLSEAHVALAYGRMIGEWDRRDAEREFQRAIELNPESAAAHHLYGWFLASRGRMTAALEEVERAIAVEPFRMISLTNRGTILYFSRRYEEAADQLGNTLDLDRSFAVAHQWLGRTLEAMGRYPEAIAAHRRALDLLGNDPESIASLGHALGRAGDREEAMRLAERLGELAQSKYVSPYWEALQQLGLGEADRALDGLERAFEDRFDWVLFLHVEPAFDAIRGDARFDRLVARIERLTAGAGDGHPAAAVPPPIPPPGSADRRRQC